MARVQITPGATHALPTLHSLLWIGWLSIHLSSKDKQRITSEHGCDVIVFQLAADGQRLGLSQTPDQCDRIGILNGLFIDTADLDAMGNGRLLEQTTSCRGR